MQFGPDRLHHPVFTNRGNRRPSKGGRFCRDFVAYFQRSRSLPTITVSRLDSWPSVSAPKNSVPGALNFGGNETGRSSGNCRLRGVREGCEVIADSMGGL